MFVPFGGHSGPTIQSTCLELSESTYAGGLEQPTHGHHPAYFTAVLSGEYEERTGRVRRVVGSGVLLYHPADEEHAVRFIARDTRVFRILPLAPMLEAERLTRASFASALARAESGAHDIVARMREHYLAADPAAPLVIDGLACELIVCCAGGRGGGSWNCAGASRARDLLEANLGRPPSLNALAAVAGCHPITLARAFRRSYGCSIGAYVRRRRLEQASSMLRTTALPISAVSARTGFADQAHLTRALRRATGYTPAVLRAFKTN
ncbi:MAG TPA: AraC family transcriptional regulator [Gemmatimonadaceae bacterium]